MYWALAATPIPTMKAFLSQDRLWLAPDSIWRDRSFQLLWLGYAVSAAGTAVTRVVLPILIFQLTGSAFQTSAVLIIWLFPYLTIGLLAGAVADRVNRRLLMIGADLVSALTLAVIPLMSVTGALSVPVIYLVAFLSATAFVFGNAAELGALPAIVGRDRLVVASSALGAVYEIMFVVASALGGVFATTIGAAAAIWIDVGSYLVAALALARIPRAFGLTRQLSEATAGQRAGRQLARDITEGLRFVWRHQLIRPLTVIGFGNSFAIGAVLGLMVVYGVRQLGLADDDARLGWLFSAGWAGALMGVVILPRLTRRFGAGRLILLALAANASLLCAVALSANLVLSLLVLLAWQTTWALVGFNGRALRQRLTPDRLQGRANITAQIFSWGGQPFGAAFAGALADLIDVRVGLLAAAIVIGASAVYAWCTPLHSLTDHELQRLVDAADTAEAGKHE